VSSSGEPDAAEIPVRSGDPDRTIQPPYGIIASQLQDGLVVPFLGAGASMVGRGSERWNPTKPSFLPSGRELADYLAGISEFPEDAGDAGNLAKIASFYVESAGRTPLRKCLRRLLNQPFPCNSLHEFLADIPTPLVIVVTNYDTLLEQAFRAKGRPYDLLVYSADSQGAGDSVLWWPHEAKQPEIVDRPNEFQIDFGKRSVIFKIHGSVVPDTEKWDTFVITEEDYLDFLSRMVENSAIPAVFYTYFRERSFLFLGYSLADWNLRVILKNLNRCLSSRQMVSWAIKLGPSELERILWRNRNVRLYGMDLGEFVVRMRERLGL